MGRDDFGHARCSGRLRLVGMRSLLLPVKVLFRRPDLSPLLRRAVVEGGAAGTDRVAIRGKRCDVFSGRWRPLVFLVDGWLGRRPPGASRSGSIPGAGRPDGLRPLSAAWRRAVGGGGRDGLVPHVYAVFHHLVRVPASTRSWSPATCSTRLLFCAVRGSTTTVSLPLALGSLGGAAAGRHESGRGRVRAAARLACGLPGYVAGARCPREAARHIDGRARAAHLRRILVGAMLDAHGQPALSTSSGGLWTRPGWRVGMDRS